MSLSGPQGNRRAAQQEALIGRTLQKGEYIIEAVLGHGGMGQVFLASHAQVDVPVAIKQVRADEPLPPCVIEELDYLLHEKGAPARPAGGDFPLSGGINTDRFLREALFLARMRHPAIPLLYDYFLENASWYLVMEYVPGSTLSSYMREHAPLPPLEAINYALQMCDVLDYLHRQSPPVVFRDLKPANIILHPDGRLMMVDFGIARYFKEGQFNDTTDFGSPGYASPEQYEGSGQTDARSDLFSLGVIMHEMLSGQRPSRRGVGMEQLETLNRHNPAISPALSGLVMVATRTEPMYRFQSAHTFYQALERVRSVEERRAYRYHTLMAEVTAAQKTPIFPMLIPPPSSQGFLSSELAREQDQRAQHMRMREQTQRSTLRPVLEQEALAHQLTSLDESLKMRAISSPLTRSGSHPVVLPGPGSSTPSPAQSQPGASSENAPQFMPIPGKSLPIPMPSGKLPGVPQLSRPASSYPGRSSGFYPALRSGEAAPMARPSNSHPTVTSGSRLPVPGPGGLLPTLSSSKPTLPSGKQIALQIPDQASLHASIGSASTEIRSVSSPAPGRRKGRKAWLFVSLLLTLLLSGSFLAYRNLVLEPGATEPAVLAHRLSSSARMPTPTLQVSTSWRALPSLPGPEAENTALYVQGSIYMTGGYRGAQAVPPYSKGLLRYDIAAARWTKLDLPDFPLLGNNAAAQDEQGDLFFSGGSLPGQGSVSSNLYRYQLADETLHMISAPPNEPLGFGNAMLADQQGHLYLTEGFLIPDDPGAQAGTGWYRYDIASGLWHSLTSTPVGLGYARLAQDASGNIFLLGGSHDAGQRQPSTEIYRFDPLQDSWALVPGAAPAITNSAASCADGQGNLVVIGGYQAALKRALTTVWLVNLQTLQWQALPPLPDSRGSSLGTASCDAHGHVYLSRGAGSSGKPSSDFLELTLP